MPNIYNPNKFDLGFFLDEQRNQTYQLATSSIPNPIQGSQLLISYSFPKKHVYIKLVDNSDILCGVIRLQELKINTKNYYIVERAFTNHFYRRQGVIIHLYKYVLKLGYSLMSDGTQTNPGSMNLWKNANTLFNSKKVYIINIKTLSKRRYLRQPDHKIWGKETNDDYDLLEMHEKKYALENLYENGIITKEQQIFYNTYIDQLEDRYNIRITIE
ncbi:MAG: hypothetical protein IPG12_03305 [Saprospiraceae bacterium]|nr:hypothetical protein [Saprospiraceae bacterium]